MKDYMDDVKGLLTMYVPPDPQRMQEAYQAGKLSFNSAGGIVNFIFKDYAQPGDQMTLTFEPAKLAITHLSINTYMGDSKDAVTLQVQRFRWPVSPKVGIPEGLAKAARIILTSFIVQATLRVAVYDLGELAPS
jgi:hypothetical protein